MDAMKGKRNPIRVKVQRMAMGISAAALTLASAVGLLSMLGILGSSEDALIRQMEQNLYNIVSSKADLANSEIGKYSEHVRAFADYIHGLYMAPSSYLPKVALPASRENANIYALQRTLARRDVSLESVEKELALLGNVLQDWKPVMASNSGVIATIYFGTETGLMLSYDVYSHTSLPEEGDKEVYYDYFKSEWYRKARDEGRVCFTDVYRDVYNRGLTITCAAPFHDENGKFAGVVGMDILIADLYRNIVRLNMGDGVSAFLLDRVGNNIGPDEVSPGSSVITGEIAMPGSHRKVFLSTDGSYIVQRKINSTGWTFGIRAPQDVVLAPVQSMKQRVTISILLFLASFGAIAVLVFSVTRRFSEQLTGPIAALRRDAKKISGGNLDYRAEIHDNDEIGDLAESFNEMAASLKDYVKNLAAVTAEKERIGAELNVATQIQADMLPRIFPPFPDRKEFDIYATMTPAKEVGGDFYDFFMIDGDHMGLVMADVSGKSVPAALFMVIAKTLIKNRAMMGGSPADILSAVNEQLCDGNEAGLFVTVWLGILEISTGRVIAVNAGHEHPAVRRAGGSWELLKLKHSPAVAVREGMKFREAEFELRPGDSLFLYTDGVAEATNANDELYGTDRMAGALNSHADETVEELLPSMKREVDRFVGDAPQFDDITMLALRYHGKEMG